jgi:hypothetical protein
MWGHTIPGQRSSTYSLIAQRLTNWPVQAPEGLHPNFWRIHQMWFNFVSSMMGWFAAYYLLTMLTFSRHEPGATDVVLLLVAALGITGYLPKTIAGIAASFQGLGKKLTK